MEIPTSYRIGSGRHGSSLVSLRLSRRYWWRSISRRAAIVQGSMRSDEIWSAINSGDLAQMERAVEIPTNLTDRHFLLMNLCREAYRLRKRPEMRTKYLHYARMHLAEFPRLKPSLLRDLLIDGLPHVPTFQDLATVLTEDGAFDEAVQICEQAKALGLDDGTKSGYDGRIARIRKRQTQAQAKRPGGEESPRSRE
jgi:hypothetical protein